MYLIYYFIFLLLLFLPTFIANAIPVIIKNIPIISDFKKPINEKLFWKNKTYRGFVFWILFAIIVSLVEFKLINNIWIEYIRIEYYTIVSNIYIAIFILINTKHLSFKYIYCYLYLIFTMILSLVMRFDRKLF